MSRFLGNGALMSGGYVMSRRFGPHSLPSWTGIDFRTDSWVGDCPLLTATEQESARNRAEIKRVSVYVESGGGSVQLADEEVPGDRVLTADPSAGFPSLDRLYHNLLGRYRVWIRTPSSPTTYEIEIEFDVPPASDI